MTKKLIKKVKAAVKKVKESVVFEKDGKYDEFGTCVACKGGKVGCLHNNLGYSGRSLVCLTCSKVMS